jgi:hypothetical protein
MGMSNSTAAVSTEISPLLLAAKASLEAAGYDIEVITGLTAGDSTFAYLYVSSLDLAIDYPVAKVELDEDGHLTVSKAFESNKVRDVKAIYAIVTLAARGL